jgi:hypothetical protein
MDSDLSTQAAMVDLATDEKKSIMFPCFSRCARILLLLPLGTATVERSFSTLNRILTDQRCRLSPDHVRQLMLLSVEGNAVPDVRSANAQDELDMQKLVDKAYRAWLLKPRRLH